MVNTLPQYRTKNIRFEHKIDFFLLQTSSCLPSVWKNIHPCLQGDEEEVQEIQEIEEVKEVKTEPGVSGGVMEQLHAAPEVVSDDYYDNDDNDDDNDDY